jgi:hypothetical protein
MESNSRIENEKINGHNLEIWKLKNEYLLIHREQWKVVCLGTMLTGMSTK